MCGRYYVDDEMEEEIEKIIRQIDKRLKYKATGDIHPTEQALVLNAEHGEIIPSVQKWGIPGYIGKQVVFNARSETVLTKKIFREGMENRRVIIPASGFYEWNKNKEKYRFYLKNSPVIYMAGIYNRYEDGEHFTILTTNANASMLPVHDRMPVLLADTELRDWLCDFDKAMEFSRREPMFLDKNTDFEQMSFI